MECYASCMTESKLHEKYAKPQRPRPTKKRWHSHTKEKYGIATQKKKMAKAAATTVDKLKKMA